MAESNKKNEKTIQAVGNTIRTIEYELVSESLPERMDVNYDIVDINSVPEEKGVLRVDYITRVTYFNTSTLKITGSLYVTLDDPKLLSSTWKKEGKLDEFYGASLLQSIYYFVSPILVTLTSMLGYPPAIIPTIFPISKEQKAKRIRKNR